MAKMTLTEQAQEILKIAEEQNITHAAEKLFKRYQMQLVMLYELEKSIKEDGILVEKEYVKGRKNLYSSPAVKDYNATTDSANRTVATLMKIIKNYNVSDTTEDADPLMKIINGGEDDGGDEQ